jgi:NAD-dependent DNA ligase
MGFINAILEDNCIDKKELKAICEWAEIHRSDLEGTYPFDEVSQLAIEGVNSSGEDYDDIFDELNEYFENLKFTISTLRSDPNLQDKIRELHGMMKGVKSDGVITIDEVEFLKKWIHKNNDTVDEWPVSELYDILVEALEDGKIDESESERIIKFCSQFDEKNPEFYTWQETEDGFLLYSKAKSLDTITSVLSDIKPSSLEEKVVCFTGIMEVARSVAKAKAGKHGCVVKSGVSGKVDYLIVGKKSNPCYSQSTYGTKIQKAMELGVTIIPEETFFFSIGEGK